MKPPLINPLVFQDLPTYLHTYLLTYLPTYLSTYLPTSPYPILVPINKLNAKNATTNLEENARVGMQLHKAKQSILALAVCCPNREREREREREKLD